MPDNRFIPYCQHQGMLLPLNLDEMIPSNHLARVISDLVDCIDTSALTDLYGGGGRPAHHPVMLLKVLTFAYASGIYSSRKIEEALRQNIFFMWLSGQATIDHTTLSRFRGERIALAFDTVFSEVVLFLGEQGFLDLDTYFLDGTKIEANANKFTFVWSKNTKRYHDALRKKIAEHLDEIDKLNAEEDALLGDWQPEDLSSDDIEEAARKIDERLKKRPKDKNLKKAAKAIEKDYLPRMKRYESQKEIAGKRSSHSKTDNDATFMRMKEDHMQQGQLKAGYNVQISSSEQFIVGYSLHQTPGDTQHLKSHLNHLQASLGRRPKTLVADAGYGSEENYQFLEDENITAVVKYPLFHKELTGVLKKNRYRVENFIYNKEDDTYLCPEGTHLDFSHEKYEITATGYRRELRVYECHKTSSCPVAKQCTGSKYNRRIAISQRGEVYKDQAREILVSIEGEILRKKRSTDVETVFGNIKQNMDFRRFSLRGLKKVSVEWGWIALGHNMRKLALQIP